MSFTPASPTTADTVNFNAASSSDPDGSISSYAWDFGDSTSASSSNATTTHNYSTAGSYQTVLKVIDNQNASSTASTTITVTAPGQISSVLFEQSDSSGEIFLAGDQYFSFGNGVNGSANKLKVKFKPDNVTVNNQYYIAPVRIRENGGAELDFWYSGNETKANQPKYCFTTAESNISKEVIFTFADSLNFLSSKTYDVYLGFLRDVPGDVCSNNQNVGTGDLVQGWWAANASNTLVYFQIGN
ncbi:MAG: PKD domain-containing protein [Parcubacteria group bacterium]|nr:PKD domain-containing protein [Parcubacteria group bacterium]